VTSEALINALAWSTQREPALPCRHSSTEAMQRLELPSVAIHESEPPLFHIVDLA
jgi:hypothetical protein